MTPKVQEVLLDARRKIYATVADRFSASDMQALHVLSCLLVTDAQCENELAIDLSEDGDSESALQAELRRVEAERKKDSAIINGLVERIKRLEGGACSA